MNLLKIAAALIAGVTLYSTVAWAGCPPGTAYSCSQGAGGKVICGCR
jgi:hypothetical protein